MVRVRVPLVVRNGSITIGGGGHGTGGPNGGRLRKRLISISSTQTSMLETDFGKYP